MILEIMDEESIRDIQVNIVEVRELTEKNGLKLKKNQTFYVLHTSFSLL